MAKNYENEKRRGWFLTVPARVDECDCDDAKHSCAFSEEWLHLALAGLGYTGQLEQGDGGFLHWQVFVHGKSPVSFSRLRNAFLAFSTKGINIEVPRDAAKCQEYVNKAETRVGEPFVSDAYKPVKQATTQKKLPELRQMVLDGMSVDDLILAETMSMTTIKALREVEDALRRKRAKTRGFKPLEVSYIYGVSGVGKSYSVYKNHDRDDLYVAADKNMWDGYNYESTVLIDEFSDSRLSLTELLNALDAYTPTLSARYRNKIGVYDKVYILSNVPLSAHYRDESDARFNALCRRITTYACMDKRGHLTYQELPLRGQDARPYVHENTGH